MKTKHTPGPWLVGSYDDGVVFGGDAYAVARMIEPIDRKNAKKKSIANANLIAAAPELLAALVAMLELDEANHQRHTGDDDVCCEVRLARRAVMMALAPNPALTGGTK